MLAKGHSCFSDSKDLRELNRHGRQALPHSAASDSTDYDAEGNEQMKQVLGQMPALLPPPFLKQALPATSRAGQQQPQPAPPLLQKQQPPPPPMQLPTTSTSGMTTKLLPMPPADEPVHAEKQLSPSVRSLFDTHTELQQKERKKQKMTERLLMALPGMALPKASAGPCMTAQLEVIQQVLVDTEDQVPADATHSTIEALAVLISPIPTLQPSSPNSTAWSKSRFATKWRCSHTGTK